MDYIATRIKNLLGEEFFLKRMLISKVANKYYRKGYEDGQKLVYKTRLKGEILQDFIKMLDDCGIKLTYDLSRGGLIVSIRSDKIPNLKKLLNEYSSKD